MQMNDPPHEEVPRAASQRLPETYTSGLPDAEAFRLTSDRLLGVGRSYTTGERRTRHPDTDDRRNGIFERMVSGDEDVPGLIAYAIYKQNKRDWLKAFETARSRAPTLDEEISYTLGESTPRRLAMYRQMAEATFIAQGASRRLADQSDGGELRLPPPPPENQPAPQGLQRVLQESAPARRETNKSLVAMALYAAVLLFAGLGLWASLRFLFPSGAH